MHDGIPGSSSRVDNRQLYYGVVYGTFLPVEPYSVHPSPCCHSDQKYALTLSGHYTPRQLHHHPHMSGLANGWLPKTQRYVYRCIQMQSISYFTNCRLVQTGLSYSYIVSSIPPSLCLTTNNPLRRKGLSFCDCLAQR
jgi:hypothetical protein